MLDFIVETAQLAGKEAMLHFGRLKESEVSSKGTVRDLVSVADHISLLYVCAFASVKHKRLILCAG